MSAEAPVLTDASVEDASTSAAAPALVSCAADVSTEALGCELDCTSACPDTLASEVVVVLALEVLSAVDEASVELETSPLTELSVDELAEPTSEPAVEVEL